MEIFQDDMSAKQIAGACLQGSDSKPSPTMQITETIRKFTACVERLAVTTDETSDRLYGQTDEKESSPECAPRQGEIGALEDALDQLGRSISNADNRLTRLVSGI